MGELLNIRQIFPAFSMAEFLDSRKELQFLNCTKCAEATGQSSVIHT